MSELVAGKDYIDSDNKISTSLGKSTTTLRNEDLETDTTDSCIDFRSCASFTSCQSYANLHTTILRREVHTSNVSLDSGIDLDSLMGSSCKTLENEQPSTNTIRKSTTNTTNTTTIKKNYTEIDDDDDEEELNALVKRSSIRVVMERKSLMLTESSESSEEIEIDEVYEKFGRWFRTIEIDGIFDIFMDFDRDSDGYIDLAQFKRMLEKLEIPQTHLAAKHLMSCVAGDLAEKMTFCQFLLAYANLLNRMTFRKTYLRDRQTERLAKTPAVDVSQVGVSGAKLFFEAKIAMQSQQMVQQATPLPVAQIVVKHQKDIARPVIREQFKAATAVFNNQPSSDTNININNNNSNNNNSNDDDDDDDDDRPSGKD